MKPVQRILVGVEFTDAGQSALNEAALLASTFGAELLLLHALSDLGAEDVEARLVVEHTTKMIRHAIEGVTSEDVRIREPFLLPVGRGPAEALLAAIAEQQPDLVVLGAGTKTAVDRVLLGATAERVVRESLRPVW